MIPSDLAALIKAISKVLGDFQEARRSGRDPEDVQRERHERERAELENRIQSKTERRFPWRRR